MLDGIPGHRAEDGLACSAAKQKIHHRPENHAETRGGELG